MSLADCRVFDKMAASDRQRLVKTSKDGIKVTEVTLIHYGTDRNLMNVGPVSVAL